MKIEAVGFIPIVLNEVNMQRPIWRESILVQFFNSRAKDFESLFSSTGQCERFVVAHDHVQLVASRPKHPLNKRVQHRQLFPQNVEVRVDQVG